MSTDIFCKIDGINGESTDDRHKNWIEVLNYSLSIQQPVSITSGTGGRTAARASFSDLAIVKELDKSSPNLALYCSNGKHIPKIVIEMCLATEQKHTFMKYVLEDAIVSSVSPSGSGGGSKPTESVTFNYGKIEWEYTPIDHTGKKSASIKQGWNLETNKQL